MPKHPTQMVPLTVLVPPTLVAEIRSAAAATDRSMAGWLRHVVRQQLAASPPRSAACGFETR